MIENYFYQANKTVDDFVDIKDYIEFEKIKELDILLKQCYDFEKQKWLHLPFDGGFLEQEDINPKKWQMLNYIIFKRLNNGNN